MNIRRRMQRAAQRTPSRTVPTGYAILLSVAIAYLILYGAFTSVLLSRTAHTGEQAVQHARILAYLRGAPDDLAFLTGAEASHMADVRGIFRVAFAFYLAALGVLLGAAAVLLSSARDLIEPVLAIAWRWAGIGLVTFVALIVMLSATGFTGFWMLFHTAFFPQGNWQFPTDSTLITLYPLSFFQSFVAGMLVRTAIAGMTLWIAGFLLSRRKRM